MSHRREQLESSLQRNLGLIIAAGLSDPRVRGLVSVTRVQVADDLRQATVWVSVLPAEYESRTLAGLRAAGGHLHAELGKRLRARSLPYLRFELDHSLKKQAAVLADINRAMEGTGSAAPPTDDHANDADGAGSGDSATGGVADEGRDT